MRGARALLPWCCGLALAGCTLPEDVFVVWGRVVDEAGGLPFTPVRLLRATEASPVRCAPLSPVAAATTDDGGTFRFEVIRQQVTLGVPERRFFRVEAGGADGGAVSSFTFWFPEADVPLPDLPLGGAARQGALPATEAPVGAFFETLADGRVARRDAQGVDRGADLREVLRQYTVRRFDVDSLGTVDDVPFEFRVEGAALPALIGRVPRSRGARCPDLGLGDECPLTDGRYLPVALAPDTRALVLDLGSPHVVDLVRLHGLLLDGPAVEVKAEYATGEQPEWWPFNTDRVDARVFDEARTHCLEPGAFLEARLSVGRFPQPRWLRLTFPGPDGALRHLVSVQEVVVP